MKENAERQKESMADAPVAPWNGDAAYDAGATSIDGCQFGYTLGTAQTEDLSRNKKRGREEEADEQARKRSARVEEIAEASKVSSCKFFE